MFPHISTMFQSHCTRFNDELRLITSVMCIISTQFAIAKLSDLLCMFQLVFRYLYTAHLLYFLCFVTGFTVIYLNQNYIPYIITFYPLFTENLTKNPMFHVKHNKNMDFIPIFSSLAYYPLTFLLVESFTCLFSPLYC